MTDHVELAVGAREGHHEEMLFGPELLNPEEASRLLARGPGRLVVFIGEQGAGKTSLCVELYERQRHIGSNARFAGSWTLLAFEQLAHHRRFAGAPAPAAGDELDPNGREILHLALSSGGAPLHLLLANLPGEVFRRLADNQISAGDVPWLHHADKLVLIVDGARLCDPAARATTLTRVRQFAERLRSSELPHPGARLALLVSKWDLVRADPDAVRYWGPREAELIDELRLLDEQVTVLRTTAEQNRQDDGLAELRAWLLELPPQQLEEPVVRWDAPLAGVPDAWELEDVPTRTERSTHAQGATYADAATELEAPAQPDALPHPDAPAHPGAPAPDSDETLAVAAAFWDAPIGGETAATNDAHAGMPAHAHPAGSDESLAEAAAALWDAPLVDATATASEAARSNGHAGDDEATDRYAPPDDTTPGVEEAPPQAPPQAPPPPPEHPSALLELGAGAPIRWLDPEPRPWWAFWRPRR